MKKTIVVAALAAAALAFPAAPALAAPAAPPAHCLILPLLQADCREAIREHAEQHRAHMASGPRAMAEGPTLPTPPWGICRPAPEGAGYLLTCD